MSLRIADLFSVAGKTVVVTGGSRGIGEMIARAYVENGAKVILSSRKAADVEALAGQLGSAATPIPADLSQMAEIERFAAEVAKVTDKVHVLFNNAGASWGAGFDEFPEIGWDKIMDINLKSVFFLSQKLIHLLEAAATPEDNARIVNIGSIDGQHVSPIETYSYAASKAGVLHLTRMMARNLAPRNIQVNAIAPGYFPSKMTAGIADEINNNALKTTPMARWGTPEDMAGVALFLGSKASAYLCGATVTADGGYATTA
ncbi:SDR family oxidoreductase [Sandaracinobacter sp. RS1-74]|uniref:SDR family oxidoreductase n=1 Tax=Sandaracinobacteroides sayramensis TaxID=2913411 RepID=UPI001ED9FE59|nr:SDR family oxidoreductase [Sandaracinobacteroides sayramensis]MCG2839444.1 SDR family oxidoreductase [Sandaracinobacteroides sayramensis]